VTTSPIFVTQPSLPPLEEFIPYLQKIWENKILTNSGPFHLQLEDALADYLGVQHVALFNNGTIALICAIKALDLVGEVITTPYSFIATTHALLWNGLTPVFVDIDPHTLNIDPSKIEAAITPKTTAIVAVHCYGHPCDVDAIQTIADKHGLKVIYDAAHAFGVQDEHGSILNYGDLSVLSFHATKVFNTFEGGAIVCPTKEIKNKIISLRNFGIVDELTVSSVGMNGKMNEVSAAFGLLQLQHLEVALLKRKKIDAYYRDKLGVIQGIEFVDHTQEKISNYSYFPILINEHYPLSRDELYEQMKQDHIFSRRYFYPLLSNFSMYENLPSSERENLEVATKFSKRVLCLPLYADLTIFDQDRIIQFIKRNIA
jgi:dTDP-4-amino-4,6-dideoxygalactose transaminase